MVDVNKLHAGLSDYRETMIDQRHRMSEAFQEAIQQSSGLFAVYDGAHSREFQKMWQRTADWFDEYFEETANLLEFLEERLEHLSRL